MQIEMKVIDKKDILTIMPLLSILNTKTPTDLLKERVLEMSNLAHYECVGLYVDKKLIGISGLWYATKHYIGKSVQPDHVIIDASFRGQNLGKKFFRWIDNYVKTKGCEAIELDAYVSNPKSHKFYYNEGYNIYGFHFLKVLREDEKFY